MCNFLYSTNTRLSFFLGEQYYGGKHFVWCSRHFESPTFNGLVVGPPPTSSPKLIYQSLALEVQQGDRHSEKIKASKAGLLRGARHRLNAGVISQVQFEEIRFMVTAAQIQDFKPLLYIINYDAVKSDIIEVSIRKRASLYYSEFQIWNLERTNFEALDLPMMRV